MANDLQENGKSFLNVYGNVVALHSDSTLWFRYISTNLNDTRLMAGTSGMLQYVPRGNAIWEQSTCSSTYSITAWYKI